VAGPAGLPVVASGGIADGVEEIQVKVSASGYEPNALVFQRGAKVRITFVPEALTSCNNPIIFPQYKATLDLSKGQTSTPVLMAQDDFTFQCWMGMERAYVRVVEDLAAVDPKALEAELSADLAQGAGASCCGSSGATN